MITNLPMRDSPLTIKLYNRSPLSKEHNAIIDDLPLLLSSRSAWLVMTETSTNPFELSMKEYRINASDSNAFIINAGVQYMWINWETKYSAFYFVNKVKRGANNTIVLEIELDFLNTLHNGDLDTGSPLHSFSPLSSIEREHVDRFTGSLVRDSTTELPYKIDRYAEGSNAPLIRRAVGDESVTPGVVSSYDYIVDSMEWYIVYTTKVVGDQKTIIGILTPEDAGNYNLASAGVATGFPMYDMSMVDRTFSGISKIIRLPYCPVSIVGRNGNTLYFDESRFSVQQVAPQKNGLVIELSGDYSVENLPCFSRTLQDYTNTSFYLKQAITMTDISSLYDDVRYISDPKLNNSEFRGIYYVYDSSVWQLKLENFTYHDGEIELDIKYMQSSSIDSALAFEFVANYYETDEYYPCLLTSRRNNEVVCYSDDYINYIRDGYNYDIAKQTLNNFISIGSSAVMTATGNPLAGLALVRSVSGAITSEIDREKLLKKMANSSFNVSGINDSSLFAKYGKARLSCVDMLTKTEERERWNNIFHYYGYNRGGRLGRPDVTSRLWFNFLKGDIVLTSARQIPAWLYEKVKEAFKEGVTYFHRVMISALPIRNEWDLGQEKENYEISIFPTPR